MGTIVIAIGIIILLYLLFYAVFCINALIQPFHQADQTEKKHHFTILIPARNEQYVIGQLLDSLLAQHYPKEKYDILVLLNNSTDQTREVVNAKHVQILEPLHPVHSKGEVLIDAFQRLSDKDTNAYIIFDADNVVNVDYIEQMNRAVADGCVVGQGRRIGKNRHVNALTECYELFYTFQNIFFNHARSSIRQSGSLNGTGWVILKQWIDQNGFPVRTLTEDLESIAWFSSTKTKVSYIHQAVTYDEYPESVPVAIKQLKRWIFGQLQCQRSYTRELLTRFFKQPSIATLDTLCVFNMTFFVQLLLAGILLIIAFQSFDPLLANFTHHLFLGILIAYLTLVLLGMAGIRKDLESPLAYIRGILLFPLFITLWVPLLLYVQTQKDITWEPISHTRTISIEERK